MKIAVKENKWCHRDKAYGSAEWRGGAFRLWFSSRGLMTVRREHSGGWLRQESFCFGFQHFLFFFYLFGFLSSGLIELWSSQPSDYRQKLGKTHSGSARRRKNNRCPLPWSFLPFWGCSSRRRAAQEPLRQRSREAEPSCPEGECCPGREAQETGISLCWVMFAANVVFPTQTAHVRALHASFTLKIILIKDLIAHLYCLPLWHFIKYLTLDKKVGKHFPSDVPVTVLILRGKNAQRRHKTSQTFTTAQKWRGETNYRATGVNS